MKATPISITTSKVCVMIPIIENKKFSFSIIPQIKDMRRWPAIMLAVRRKVSARGRIIFLKTSTITIKLIKKMGVPKGIK